MTFCAIEVGRAWDDIDFYRDHGKFSWSSTSQVQIGVQTATGFGDTTHMEPLICEARTTNIEKIS
jgi:hypothetical protein